MGEQEAPTKGLLGKAVEFLQRPRFKPGVVENVNVDRVSRGAPEQPQREVEVTINGFVYTRRIPYREDQDPSQIVRMGDKLRFSKPLGTFLLPDEELTPELLANLKVNKQEPRRAEKYYAYSKAR